MASGPPRNRSDFTIAIICALKHEAEAVYGIMDKFWDDEGIHYGKANGDENSYTTGTIGRHNVVLVHMFRTGAISSSRIASGVQQSFPNIQLALVVGTCGGVPIDRSTKSQIYLGDLIISTAVVQFDLGSRNPDGFKVKNTLQAALGPPPSHIENQIAKWGTYRYLDRMEDVIAVHIEDSKSKQRVQIPDTRTDRLFEPTLVHKHRFRKNDMSACDICRGRDGRICQAAVESSCETLGCLGRSKGISRTRTLDHGIAFQPKIFFGQMGSSSTVMKSGIDRDQIAADNDLIGFEMEGVGVWGYFPTIVIKSVCSYADSHNNKEWQNYSAMVAAGGAKAVLNEWQGLRDDIGSITSGMAGASLLMTPGGASRPRSRSGSRSHTPQSPASGPVNVMFVDHVGLSCSRLAEAYLKIVKEWSLRTNTPFQVNWIHAAGIQNSSRSNMVDMQQSLNMHLVNVHEPPLAAAQDALFDSMSMDFVFKHEIKAQMTKLYSRGLNQNVFALYDYLVAFEADVRGDLIKLKDHMTQLSGQAPPPGKGKIVMLGEYGNRQFQQILTPHMDANGDYQRYLQQWRSTAIVIKQSLHAFLEEETGWIKPASGALERGMASSK